MYIILWLLFGAFVGWVASILMKKPNGMGLVANIIFGLVGSALGMWLVSLFGYEDIDTFSVTGLIVSVAGAAILIAVFNALKRN